MGSNPIVLINKGDMLAQLITLDRVNKLSSICQSKRHLLICLGVTPYGGNYKTLDKLIRDNNITISFLIDSSRAICATGGYRKRIPLEEILIENSKYTNSNSLRKRLIKEGIFEHKCYECNRTTWNGKKLPIEIEHKNGNNRDNRLDNLTILCNNCHAQTKFFRGRKTTNKKIKEKITTKVLIEKKRVHCQNCDNILNPYNKTGYCIKCSRGLPRKNKRKVVRPEKEELGKLIKNLPITSIGKKYGVSGNAVKKWVISYGL